MCRLPLENTGAVRSGFGRGLCPRGALTFSPLCSVLLLQVSLRRPQPEHARQLRLQPGLPLRRRPPAQHRLSAQKEQRRARVTCAGLPSGRRGHGVPAPRWVHTRPVARGTPWGDQVAHLRSRFLGGAFPELIAHRHVSLCRAFSKRTGWGDPELGFRRLAFSPSSAPGGTPQGLPLTPSIQDR